jgi:hypothetical protein
MPKIGGTPRPIKKPRPIPPKPTKGKPGGKK